MDALAVFLTIVILIVSILGCAIVASPALTGETAPTPYPTAAPTPSDTQARALEAQEAIERARAEQIRAEGEKARAEAAAESEVLLAEAAARAIDRQGRLLTAYIVAGQGRVFGVGLLVGIVLTTISVAVAIEYRRVQSQARDETAANGGRE